MHKALHSRYDIDRLYVPRKEGGRGLTSIEDSVDASIQRLEDQIENQETKMRGKTTLWPLQGTNDNNQETKMGRKTTPWAF